MTVESQDTSQSEVEAEQETRVEDESESYEIALEKGLEELDYKNYEKAIEHFERALVERAEDERAEVLLSQTKNYIEAEESFERGEHEEGRVKAESVQSLENGSETLNARASKLLAEAEVEDEDSSQEDVSSEAVEVREEEMSTEAVSAEEVTTEAEPDEWEEQVDESQDSSYEYNDFVGYYLHFHSSERSQSDMIVTIGSQYLTIGWYASELELYEIQDWSIDENALIIDYYLHPYVEGEGEHGSLSVSLSEANGEQYIDFGTDMPFYRTTYDQVQNYGYTMPDTVVEDVN